MSDYDGSVVSVTVIAEETDTVDADIYEAFPISLGTGLEEYWVNKAWDPGGPAWVEWETEDDPDSVGASYPDTYGTGFSGTVGYRVSVRRYK